MRQLRRQHGAVERERRARSDEAVDHQLRLGPVSRETPEAMPALPSAPCLACDGSGSGDGDGVAGFRGRNDNCELDGF